jgi:hypothetical protein
MTATMRDRRPACPPPRVRASRVVLGSRHVRRVAGARPAPPSTRVARGGGGEYAGGRFRITPGLCERSSLAAHGARRVGLTPLARRSRGVRVSMRTRRASGRAAHRLDISEAYVNSPPPPRAHSRSRPSCAEYMQCSARIAPAPRASGVTGRARLAARAARREARPAPPAPLQIQSLDFLIR